MNKSAIISACGKYRYMLTRKWGEGRECVFIMLNPSTADAELDDPTIRRCISFAQREDCGSLVVLNLYAYRATDPKELRKTFHPLGPLNDHWLDLYAYDDGAGNSPLIIAAWGANAEPQRAKKAMEFYRQREVYALGVTKHGQPRHPLYLKNDAPLIPFNDCAKKARSEMGKLTDKELQSIVDMLKGEETDDEQIREDFDHCFGKKVSDKEFKRCKEFIEDQLFKCCGCKKWYEDWELHDMTFDMTGEKYCRDCGGY